MGVEGISAMLAAGPYRWPAHDLTAIGVVTNRVGAGAYRAPGAPPAAFAVETLIDRLAAELGLDPIELRLRNVLVAGDAGIDGQEIKSFGARECLERVREHPLWQRRGELPDGEGVGVAIGFWPGGLEPAAAICRLDSDGRLTVITAAADMSGIDNAFATIAAETFGLAEDRVRVSQGDTGERALRRRERRQQGHLHVRARDRARGRARRASGCCASPRPSWRSRPRTSRSSTARCGRSARPGRGDADRRAGGQDADVRLARTSRSRATAASPRSAARPARRRTSSHVRVDRETGGVTLLGHVIAQDVGRALNPALVEGQMQGGTAQGIGWALLEELAYDEDGQLRGGSFAEYALPSSELVPPIETLIVEVPAPDGPFGAKGVGEPPVVRRAAARRQRDRGGDRRAAHRAADDAAAGVGGIALADW